ncbi:zincin-like metallopeptidase domain-containing protein [Vibrio sp.]|uniref:zincin-like metallopeptidase domain-containing protein n=1 Tax=Vibrio sp. TaxID=678 RepID=UPI00311E73FD
MKKPRSSAGRTTAKTDQQNEILNRLFDYFSKPKGEKPSSENDINVSFYRSALNALPRNFHDNNYNGVNIIMLLQAQEESATKVPIYATFKQAAALLEQYKDQLPPKSETFDPDKPLKGLKLDAQVVKYLETYKKEGEVISKAKFENETKGMSFKEMHDKGYLKRKGLKPYKVFPIERIKHLLPQSYIDERSYFAKQAELESQQMSEEMRDQEFVEKAQLIIDAMGVPVIEKNEDRAYYSPSKHEIVIPPRHKFRSDKAYFAVILHEISHSTSRHLGRDISSTFGSASYSKEELIAETATMFMCLDEGLETFHSHARYLEGWSSHFSDNKKVLLSVCKQAKEAQQYISDKVAEHKLKLEQQASYSIPNQLDQRVTLNSTYRDELSQFIDTQSRSFGLLIPLKNQRIIGFNHLAKGLEIYTDEKKVNVYGPSAKSIEHKLQELDVKQELFCDSMLDIEPDNLTMQKPRNGSRLSL